MCGAVTPGVVTLDFAHFANGSSITAGLVLVNVASHPIRPELYFYDRGGKGIAAESVVEITEELEVAEDGSLTRISHRQSTAAPQSSALAALRSVGLLDVLHEYDSGGLGRKPCQDGACTASLRPAMRNPG